MFTIKNWVQLALVLARLAILTPRSVAQTISCSCHGWAAAMSKHSHRDVRGVLGGAGERRLSKLCNWGPAALC
jgi:hypothetical protein